ncbi:MAG: hypothetical protein A4E66_00909 [Syntrophus sp. PtaB.Bin001]|nr:MAG: hypothetical protein A4E66_00909 [Syntrophus sp. PtaB.Bin001]
MGMCRQQVFQLPEAVVSAAGRRGAKGAPVTVRRLGLDCREKQFLVGGMEQVDAAHADRPQGVSVVGVGKGDKSCLAGVSPRGLLLILKGHFQGNFHCGGAAFRIKHPG